jgi:hypothetical protein
VSVSEVEIGSEKSEELVLGRNSGPVADSPAMDRHHGKSLDTRDKLNEGRVVTALINPPPFDSSPPTSPHKLQLIF